MNTNILLYISKIIALIVFLLIFFSGSIRSIKNLKDIRAIHESKKILIVESKFYFKTLYLIIVGLLFIVSAFSQQILIEKIVFIAFGIIIFIDPIRNMMELMKSGIYPKGVIFPNYSAEWENIEKYQRLEKGIRLIHKQKGAFDIVVNDTNIEELERLMKSKGIEEI